MPTDSSVEKYILSLLSQAVEDQGTEIAIGGDTTAARNAVSIRYQVGGVWYDLSPFPQEIRQRVLDRLWQMAGLSTEGGFPKQGVFATSRAGRQVEWRLHIKSIDSSWVLIPASGTSNPPSK